MNELSSILSHLDYIIDIQEKTIDKLYNILESIRKIKNQLCSRKDLNYLLHSLMLKFDATKDESMKNKGKLFCTGNPMGKKIGLIFFTSLK